jgi:hypothetical protein
MTAQAKAQLHLHRAEGYRRGAPFVYPRLTAPFLADHRVSIRLPVTIEPDKFSIKPTLRLQAAHHFDQRFATENED